MYLSMFPQAVPVAVGSVSSDAEFIIAFNCGSLTWLQLELLTGMLTANGTDRMVSGLSKSRTQPADGQTSISAFGTPQYFPYIADWSTSDRWTLKPSEVRSWSTIWAIAGEFPPLPETTWTVSVPVYL